MSIERVERGAAAIMREAGCVRSEHPALPRCEVHMAPWRDGGCRDAYDFAEAVLEAAGVETDDAGSDE